MYNHHWKVTGGGATTPWSDGPSNGMRFDSSKSLGSNFYDAGVIFDRVTPLFFYDRAQNDTEGVAKHIYDALYKPQTTYPTKAGKVVPGDIWNGHWRPLHRNWTRYDADAAETTRKKQNPSWSWRLVRSVIDSQDDRRTMWPAGAPPQTLRSLASQPQ
ncbi:hypothetical protein [Streptomyces sp. 1222.5]|uniref:hypothetical protein n=1 Tax=Streptomyces sp. 1222.5 TaxID=1881026 RepID=UPI003D7382B2